jgi:hypothetical protein
MAAPGVNAGRWIAGVLACALCGVLGAGVALFGPGGNPASYSHGFPTAPGRCETLACPAPEDESFVLFIASPHEWVNDTAERLSEHALFRSLGQAHRVDVALRDLESRARDAGWIPVFSTLDENMRSEQRAWARLTGELEIARVEFPYLCEMYGDSDREHTGLCGQLIYRIHHYPLPPLHRGFPLCRQSDDADYAPLETDAGEALAISDTVGCDTLAPELWGWRLATAQPDRKDSVAFESDGGRVEVADENGQIVIRFTP